MEITGPFILFYSPVPDSWLQIQSNRESHSMKGFKAQYNARVKRDISSERLD